MCKLHGCSFQLCGCICVDTQMVEVQEDEIGEARFERGDHQEEG